MGVSEMTMCEAKTSQMTQRSFLGLMTERILFALLMLLFLTRGLIPSWNHLGSDFADYYLVARLYRTGYPVERVYEWTWLQRQKDHAGIERPLVGFAPSTLTSALLVLPVSSMSPLQANRTWLVISLGLLLSSAALLKKITDLPWRRLGLIMCLAVAPLHTNFLLGQVHAVMLFLLTLAAWLYLTDRPFRAGLAVAAAAAFKIYPAFFLLFFLLRKQWRAVTGLLVGAAGAILLSIWLFGIDAFSVYLHEVLPSGLRGEIIDPYAIGWDSLNSLLRRLFIYEPELNPSPVAHVPYLCAFLRSVTYAVISVIFLWAISFKSPSRSRQKLVWATFCFLLLLLSSEPLPYHFVVLILSAALVSDCLIAEGQLGLARLVVVLYALVCIPYDRLYRFNPRGWFSLLAFPRLYSMLLLGGAFLYVLMMSEGEPLLGRLRSRSFGYAVIAFVAISAGGFAMDLLHMEGQFDNYKTRVVTTVGSAIAVDPVVTSDSVLYGSLAPTFTSRHDAYVIHRVTDNSVISCGGGGDWFHPTATMDGQTTWAEVAAVDHSRIVRFGTSDCLQNPPITEIEDGEQPSVSMDGRTLSYIREFRGRGSLFIHHLQDEPNLEHELAGPQYDVREATFSPEGEIAFSSWQHHRYHLFLVEPKSDVVAEMNDVNCSARYPAFSPDGEWLAFSCEHGGVWQIVVKNRGTGEQQLLTSANCNSIAPAWTRDSKSLIYATDCGRALGITALSRLRLMR